MPAVQMYEAMVAYWQAIGLNITRRNVDVGVYRGENRSNTIPGIYNFGGSNPVDGGRLTWVRFSRGSTWSDAVQRDDYDAAFEAIQTEGDPIKRAELIGGGWSRKPLIWNRSRCGGATRPSATIKKQLNR